MTRWYSPLGVEFIRSKCWPPEGPVAEIFLLHCGKLFENILTFACKKN